MYTHESCSLSLQSRKCISLVRPHRGTHVPRFDFREQGTVVQAPHVVLLQDPVLRGEHEPQRSPLEVNILALRADSRLDGIWKAHIQR